MSHPFANLGPQIIKALGAPAAVSVTRRSGGAYVDGRWTSGALVLLSVDAVVQPSTPRETRQLPENERANEAISLWTNEALLTSDVPGAIEADVVTWQGKNYRVLIVENWVTQAGYAKAIAVRVGE